MTVKSCEKLEKSRVALTIETSAEEFEAAVNKAYLKMRGKINVPGFRVGKAPRKIIEKMYGAEVFYEEAVNAILPDAYESAVDEQKLEVVGYPEVELESCGKDGVVFKCTVAIYPEVKLGQYKGLEAPKTFDDLYEILKAYKADYPDSYPLTILAGPRVLFRMTMPSFGISVGKNSADGSYVLSYDYDNKDFFAGAIDDKCKEYFAFLSKLYSEGLLDPEMADPIDGDKWSQKLATGSSMATYAYYDQIGGVEAASEIDGFKLQMYAPLEGPAGAHHQPKSRTGSGIMFPKKTAERDDFERIVRTIDEMFYSEENAKLWCLGVEGETYTMDGDKIVYSDDIVNSADGIYKSMQLKYGCGSDVTQMVWINEREMSKYDENYAEINTEVAAMNDAIQPIPPTPQFDDLTAEDAASLRTPLGDTFEVWADAFITGKKSTDTDWDAYVAEMKNLSIDQYLQMYNDNNK